MEAAIYIIGWYAIGLTAIPLHIWWTTRGGYPLDWEVSDLIFCLFMAIMGPCNVVVLIIICVGSLLSRYFNGRKILFARRQK